MLWHTRKSNKFWKRPAISMGELRARFFISMFKSDQILEFIKPGFTFKKKLLDLKLVHYFLPWWSSVHLTGIGVASQWYFSIALPSASGIISLYSRTWNSIYNEIMPDAHGKATLKYHRVATPTPARWTENHQGEK